MNSFTPREVGVQLPGQIASTSGVAIGVAGVADATSRLARNIAIINNRKNAGGLTAGQKLSAAKEKRDNIAIGVAESIHQAAQEGVINNEQLLKGQLIQKAIDQGGGPGAEMRYNSVMGNVINRVVKDLKSRPEFEGMSEVEIRGLALPHVTTLLSNTDDPEREVFDVLAAAETSAITKHEDAEKARITTLTNIKDDLVSRGLLVPRDGESNEELLVRANGMAENMRSMAVKLQDYNDAAAIRKGIQGEQVDRGFGGDAIYSDNYMDFIQDTVSPYMLSATKELGNAHKMLLLELSDEDASPEDDLQAIKDYNETYAEHMGLMNGYAAGLSLGSSEAEDLNKRIQLFEDRFNPNSAQVGANMTEAAQNVNNMFIKSRVNKSPNLLALMTIGEALGPSLANVIGEAVKNVDTTLGVATLIENSVGEISAHLKGKPPKKPVGDPEPTPGDVGKEPGPLGPEEITPAFAAVSTGALQNIVSGNITGGETEPDAWGITPVQKFVMSVTNSMTRSLEDVSLRDVEVWDNLVASEEVVEAVTQNGSKGSIDRASLRSMYSMDKAIRRGLGVINSLDISGNVQVLIKPEEGVLTAARDSGSTVREFGNVAVISENLDTPLKTTRSARGKTLRDIYKEAGKLSSYLGALNTYRKHSEFTPWGNETDGYVGGMDQVTDEDFYKVAGSIYKTRRSTAGMEGIVSGDRTISSKEDNQGKE